MWGRGKFSTLEDSWLYISMWGFRSFAAVTQRHFGIENASVLLLLSWALCYLQLTALPPIMGSQRRQWRPAQDLAVPVLAATAVLSFCRKPAVPCGAKPPTIGDTHCLEPGETQTRGYGGQRSSRAFGHMSCTFLFIPSTGLHSTYFSVIRWFFFLGPFQLNYSMLLTLKSATPKQYQTCPSRNSKTESQDIKIHSSRALKKPEIVLCLLMTL